MTYGFPPWGDGASDTGVPVAELASDVPCHLGVLPDGREALIYGDVAALAEGLHQQGENSYHFGNTCGLCACAGVLRQMGLDVIEDDVVRQAVASKECWTGDNPAESGGTWADSQVRLLNDFGVPAHLESMESLEELAAVVEQGRGVMIATNAGMLWDDGDAIGNGRANHSVQVTAVALDPLTAETLGFYINDSGIGAAGHFHDAETIQASWLAKGGCAVVTDVLREVHA
jgi:hypothetical protein